MVKFDEHNYGAESNNLNHSNNMLINKTNTYYFIIIIWIKLKKHNIMICLKKI